MTPDDPRAPGTTPWDGEGVPGPLGTERDLRDGHPRQCTARSKRSGKRCRAFAVRGASVCRTHGGAAPAVRAKAQARLLAQQAEADAGRVLAHEATERLENPLEALGRLAVEALALKDALAARVNALDRIRAGAGEVEQLRVEVSLYERALDRSAKFLDLLARNNWEERRVELEQGRAQLVTAAFLAALEAVTLLPDDRQTMIHAFLTGIGRPPPEKVRGELG